LGCAALIFGAILSSTAVADAACSPDRIEVVTESSRLNFAVEVADDPLEQQIGLMNRPHLASAAGMLFVFDAPKRAQFWMKNTLIPLDMVFADPSGSITHIHENAIPNDLTTIDGGENVQFVLEINGGLARRMGIGLGDQLAHPSITGSACGAQ
jgi:uncharacterized protein